jgi:hypothetical protein
MARTKTSSARSSAVKKDKKRFAFRFGGYYFIDKSLIYKEVIWGRENAAIAQLD